MTLRSYRFAMGFASFVAAALMVAHREPFTAALMLLAGSLLTARAVGTPPDLTLEDDDLDGEA